MTWVWSASRSEPTDRLVLLAIADTANDDGAEAYPSMATLTRKTGLHERSIQRALKRLTELGELTVYPNAGPKGCNRYRIRMTPPAQSHPGTESPRQNATPAQSRKTPGTAPPPPRQNVGGTPGTAPPEPSLNHPSTVLEPSTAQQIVAEWIDRCAKRPPKPVVGQMAKQIDALLAEGIDPDDVRRGIAQWMTRDVHPSVLPSIVNSVMNGSRASPRGYVDLNGLKLTTETAQRMTTDRQRLAAMDAERQAIEGPK